MAASQQMLLSQKIAAGGGGSVEIVNTGSTAPGFGSTRTMPVPAGAATGDRLIVVFIAFEAVTAFTDDESTVYTDLAIADATADDVHYISAPLGASIPTTISVTFAGNVFLEKADVYVVRGVSATVSDSGAFSTGFSTDPRSHAYTTSATDDLVIGIINFPGGGVTGVTGADGDHEWVLDAALPTGQSFGRVVASAGSYGATLGPTGAGSVSDGYWFTLEAA